MLTVNLPVGSGSSGIRDPRSGELKESSQVFLGCNLLPTKSPKAKAEALGRPVPESFTLLVTPLEVDEKILHPNAEVTTSHGMASAQGNASSNTPGKAVDSQSGQELIQVTPPSPPATADDDSFAEGITSKSSPRPISRIEDSFEALDQLEEQLEAFDVAASVRHVVSPDAADPSTKTPTRPVRASSQGVTTEKKSTPSRTTAKAKTVRTGVEAALSGKQSAAHRSPHMQLDTPKLKAGDKPAAAAPGPEKPSRTRPASLLPPKPLSKSSKTPTVPTFELTGEAVARRLKEKREARMSMQGPPTTQAASSPAPVRRTKSAKAPTVPTFELPGEAISRRKREEREAKLRAQEEEERKRREFKAKPIRSVAGPSTLPRGTVASRARQGQAAALPENPNRQAPNSPTKHSSTVVPHSRQPLSNNSNTNSQGASVRGRVHGSETSSASQLSRATSTSNGSIGGKRSSASGDDAHRQRLSGKEIYHRDNSYVPQRERERRDRESLARAAREAAAERSRLASREWAEKQRRKRMTISSVQDLAK